jgi:H+/gluconate symporter-like permease
VSLGTWLLFGIVIGPLTALITTLVMRFVLRGGFWKSESDEEVNEALAEQEAHETSVDDNDQRRSLPLAVLLLPILVPLVMIAFGAFADLFDFSTSFIAFLGNANFALFVGLVGAYLLSRTRAGLEPTRDAMDEGFHTTGEILLITGVGGSLGAVITETSLDKVLADLFQADAGAPVILSILLAWFIAALLHLAIGSVSVAAITAAGIIAPIVGSLGVAPVVIGLAIASGALFALQVNSNFFWMFKALLGLSTKGSLKTLTMATSVASVVSLPMVVVVSLFA